MNPAHDGQLLADVAANASQASFEELVRRHGAMAYNECRRLLSDAHDAEDAAQAVFLVLWKKAGSLRSHSSVAAWLHRVARNVCRNAQRANSVRKSREGRAVEMTRQSPNGSNATEEIRDLLDEELDRLPEKYRLPLILFHLEGRSLEEIAALMDMNPSTLGTRLSRGREMLRNRLTRRGVAVSTTALVAALGAEGMAAILPATFVAATVHSAQLFAMGNVAAAGALSAQTAALANGVIHMLNVTTLKFAAAAIVAASLLVGGMVAVVKMSSAKETKPAKPLEIAELQENKTGAVTEAKPLHDDPKMAEIIRIVRDNENRYKDLETVVKIERRVANSDNPKQWSEIKSEERRRTVSQGELLYYEGNEVRTTSAGQTIRNDRVSAYDGEKTRTVNVGNSVNVHFGQHESPYVYPPHAWSVGIPHMNFPLSVFLQGTDAVRDHPKVHRYGREGGSIFEFASVESAVDGEDVVNGLKCVRVRCERGYASRGGSAKSLLWLALERNYLCIKSQTFIDPSSAQASFETSVDELREVAPGIWLPARVTTTEHDFKSIREGKQVAEWINTLVLESAALRPGHPAQFFRDISIPADLPIYTIENGRLAGGGFETAEPPNDSGQTLKDVITKVRANELLYGNLEVELERRYSVLHPRLTQSGSGVNEHLKMSTVERSYQREGKSGYAEQTRIELADGSSAQSDKNQGFDGKWMRALSSYHSIGGPRPRSQLNASLGKQGASPFEVHRPHMLIFRHNMSDFSLRPLAEFLSGIEQSEKIPYAMTAEWLGHDDQNGLRCDVVRVGRALEPSTVNRSSYFRVLWLASERNYLPVRCEDVDPERSGGVLPVSITTAEDLREIAPRIWFPFAVTTCAFHSWGSWTAADVSVKEMVVARRTEYSVKKAALNPEPQPDQYAGPVVPAGTPVSVSDETGQNVGQYTQPETGALMLAEDKYSEMLERAKLGKVKRSDKSK